MSIGARSLNLAPSFSGSALTYPIRVLFLCTGNSCRSQMAEAWARPLHGAILVLCARNSARSPEAFLREHAGERFEIHSAGVERECPKLFPGALHHHSWPFPDPAVVQGTVDERLAAFRGVRDGIRRRVLEWLGVLDRAGVPGGRRS